MKNKIRMFNIILILALFLGACNMPSSNNVDDIANTAAAQTIDALLSATSAFGTATPSFTPLPGPASLTPAPPTNTQAASPTVNCNVAQFITDVTIPDGTLMTPGQAFTKKWRIKNIGSCAWSGYLMVFDNGDSMGGPASKPISALNPGQEIDLEVNLTAPATAGNYRGYWRITTNGNVLLPIVNGYQGTSFYVDIKVQGPATATNTTAPPFAVSSVTYVLGTWNSPGFVSCPKITANITTNSAGTVNYHWTRSDGTNTNGTLVFGSATTQSISVEWSLGSAAAPAPDEWMGIYIDTPNHQDFGHITMPPCTSP
jgi:hypothetical protein